MEPEDVALRNFIASLLDKKKRLDGRGLMEYRNIDIQINPISQANGSARVKLGDTEVIVGVKIDMGEPYPDTPDEGVLITSTELSPIASKEFEPGPPRANAIEIARVVDRAIRESQMIDTSKLCVEKGEKVWMLFVDVYVVNDDGNIFDASAIAVVSALKNAVFPKYNKKEGKVEHKELTKEKVPLVNKKIPVLCTFSKLDGHLFVDANLKERLIEDSRLSIAVSDDKICAMQKGGEGAIKEEEVLKLTDEASKMNKKLKKQLKW